MQIDSAARSASKLSSFLVGPALDEAEASGESLDIFWPFDDTEIKLWPQAEAIW
jgi:actin-related protein 9